jgi:hypothetical protein
MKSHNRAMRKYPGTTIRNCQTSDAKIILSVTQAHPRRVQEEYRTSGTRPP